MIAGGGEGGHTGYRLYWTWVRCRTIMMLFTMNRNTCAACTPAVCCALRLVNIIMWIKCCRSQAGIIIIHVSSTENAKSKRPVIINDAFSKSHHVANRQIYKFPYVCSMYTLVLKSTGQFTNLISSASL